MKKLRQDTPINRSLRQFLLEYQACKVYEDFVLGSNKYRTISWEPIKLTINKACNVVGYVVNYVTYHKGRDKLAFFDLKLKKVPAVLDLFK